MKVFRKDRTLNDAIEYLDDIYQRAQSNVAVAISMMDENELAFIYDETKKCLSRKYYLENYHCIRDEHGNWKALWPWWDHQQIVYDVIEEEFANTGRCRIIVLKPRQTGISTWVSAAMFHKTIFTPHSFTMLVAQNGDTSEHVYNMSINAYHALPWWMRPEFLYKTKGDQIEFQRADENMRATNPGLGSILQCSNAQKMSGVAIGRSITNLHASEVSRWPTSDLYEGDIKPSLNAKDMFEVMESTGLGRNGLFYDQWQGAMNGDTELRPVFIPVYKVTKYYLPIRKGVWEPTVEETLFTAKIQKEENFTIPNEFWNFRRRGVRAAKTSPGGKAGFLESYPISPTEAFQASGICAFDRDSLEEQEMKYICKPIFAGEISLAFDNKTPNTDMIAVVGDDEILPKRKSDRPSKRLHIWEFPEAGETYYVSGDAALGVREGDYSNSNVMRAGNGSEPDVQVAEWWGHCPPQEFARIMAALGYWYNGAELAIEYAKEGITVGDKLVDMDYPALYRERMRDRPGGAYKHYFHFTPNEKSRSSIIATMNEALLSKNRAGDPGVIIRSIELLDEMIDFGSIGGKMEGQGNHDDGVISSMICLHCLRETTIHIKGTVNDGPRGEHVGDLNVYGVYDHLNRQRGQYQDKGMAMSVIVGKAGWTVQPILICKANTLWSPTYDDPNSAEYKLRHQHGMSSDEITPGLVTSFNAAYKQAMAGTSTDPDW